MTEPDSLADRIATSERQLLERGWAVWPSYLTPEEIGVIRAEVTGLWESLGRPNLVSPDDGHVVAANIVVNWVGLVHCDYLSTDPAVGRHFDRPDIIRLVHHMLGDDCVFEAMSCALSSPQRDFVPWHCHNGGMLHRDLIASGRLPQHARVERLVLALYCDPLGHGYGEMLVHPRRLHDLPDRPHPDESREWPGQAEIIAPAGSLLILEQTMWHAVRRSQTQELRAFQGAFVARRSQAASFPQGFRADLPSYPGASAAYQQLLQRGQAAESQGRRNTRNE